VQPLRPRPPDQPSDVLTAFALPVRIERQRYDPVPRNRFAFHAPQSPPDVRRTNRPAASLLRIRAVRSHGAARRSTHRSGAPDRMHRSRPAQPAQPLCLLRRRCIRNHAISTCAPGIGSRRIRCSIGSNDAEHESPLGLRPAFSSAVPLIRQRAGNSIAASASMAVRNITMYLVRGRPNATRPRQGR
jgi:hypothetical protein